MSKKLLFIDGSFFKDEKRSFSKALLNRLANHFERHSDFQVSKVDLNEIEHYKSVLHENNLDSYYNDPDVQNFLNQINNHDQIIISSAIINCSLSPILRNFLDSVAIPGKTFTYKKDQKPEYDFSQKKVHLIIESGGENDPRDLTSPLYYFRNVMILLGFQNFACTIIENTDVDPEIKKMGSIAYSEKILDEVVAEISK
ncbi:NAD(P)H-dependent oxidoreductase [Mycoplasmopsis gallinacea]|uniref:FMN-dependent NADH-azoreductase n=1 Tax=Mycoplasmopsis gallinacea TaxID=29556 RepID=A0A449A3J6_9BACT|nr:NAD(P)H-dependent oxidoreductase [Mycoplasmopsis gallinacea]VEU58821.1 FMN-dependent NADH-azoreductase [Mycoplasmopsis gallinacea]